MKNMYLPMVRKGNVSINLLMNGIRKTTCEYEFYLPCPRALGILRATHL